MKFILLIFLSYSSLSLAEVNSNDLNSKQVHEKLCKIMSEDFFALMILRQDGRSLVNVLREARKVRDASFVECYKEMVLAK
tara:strand:+ start:672 stop:914 length:243 start_codon:yes stop_codon:yes gene_type:complete